jgi:hypothetical protein
MVVQVDLKHVRFFVLQLSLRDPAARDISRFQKAILKGVHQVEWRSDTLHVVLHEKSLAEGDRDKLRAQNDKIPGQRASQ